MSFLGDWPSHFLPIQIRFSYVWGCSDLNGFARSNFVDLSLKDQPVLNRNVSLLNLVTYKEISPLKMQYLMHKLWLRLRISYPAPLKEFECIPQVQFHRTWKEAFLE